MLFARKSKEDRFWSWFQKNEAALFEFERDQERLFDEMNKALSKVAPELTFEFGPVRSGARDLVLSAEGLKSAFPAVERLAVAAPRLSRWRVVKFRPRRSPIMDLTIGGRTIRADEVECCVLSNGKELGVYLFFNGYSEEEHPLWSRFGYLFLDEALGEYDVEMKVSLIKFFAFTEHPDAARFRLPDLSARFDEYYGQLLQ